MIKRSKLRSSVKEKTWLEDFKKIHGDLYDYSKVEYINTYTKVKIICKTHGIFEQTPQSHLNGFHCRACKPNYEKISKNFLTQAGNLTCILYVLRCWNENENFYKIGITSKSIKDRFRNKFSMPYEYIVLEEYKGSPNFIWELEKKYHILNNQFIYKPKIKFSGSVYECFSKYTSIDINSFIEEYSNDLEKF